MDLADSIKELGRPSHASVVMRIITILEYDLERCLLRTFRPLNREMRKRLFDAYGPARVARWVEFINCILWRRRLNPSHVLRTGIGGDDLIDACACAVGARDSTSRFSGDEVDINGLQMQINS